MSDMKEFLESNIQKDGWDRMINVDSLFVFLWERGGKQFIKELKEEGCSTMAVWIAEGLTKPYNKHKNKCIAQDFLDCVSIDEERVKQLIEEKEKVKE